MTTLLTPSQQSLISSAISALINNGNAPLDTAWAIGALRDAIASAEAAFNSTSVADTQAALSALQNTITAIQSVNTAQDSAIAALSASLLNNLPNAPTRSLNTPFRISATHPADVSYSVDITSAATVVAGSRGRVYLRYADDSAMSVNVVTVSSDNFGIASGLLVTAYAALKLIGRIPAGKWVSLVTENTTGTPTFGPVTAQETTL